MCIVAALLARGKAMLGLAQCLALHRFVLKIPFAYE